MQPGFLPSCQEAAEGGGARAAVPTVTWSLTPHSPASLGCGDASSLFSWDKVLAPRVSQLEMEGTSPLQQCLAQGGPSFFCLLFQT